MVKDKVNAMVTPAVKSLIKFSFRSEISMHKNAPQKIQRLRILDFFITHCKEYNSKTGFF